VNHAVFEKLVENPPKLHFWGDAWCLGGMLAPQLRMIERLMLSLPDTPRVLETGAGLSSLVFLALGAKVTSFFTKDDLLERIEGAIRDYDLPRENWDYSLGFSELTFPLYLSQHPDLVCDLVLVDGGHMVHTAFTDFTYGYAALREGGYILIDDLQMPSVKVLYRLLKASKFVKEVEVAKKTASFRKMRSEQLPGPWGDIETHGLPAAAE
jgi:hypothetical protein